MWMCVWLCDIWNHAYKYALHTHSAIFWYYFVEDAEEICCFSANIPAPYEKPLNYYVGFIMKTTPSLFPIPRITDEKCSVAHEWNWNFKRMKRIYYNAE